jgi:hypothetical protein
MFGDVLPLERSSMEMRTMKSLKFCDARPTLYRGPTDIPTVSAWLRRHRRGAPTGVKLVVDMLIACERNLATLEELQGLRSTSQTRIRRQRAICLDMLRAVERHRATITMYNWWESQRVPCPRVRSIFRAVDLIASGVPPEEATDRETHALLTEMVTGAVS